MPSIIKKMKKGKAYYYAVESKRVKGNPRIVWQKYLGSVETIIKKFQEKANALLPAETALFEAGGIAALLHVANRIGLLDLINQIAPKRNQGPSVGHYILLAALNRALDPMSKSQIGEWYHGCVLQRLWGFSSEFFTSQRYWDHMDRISDDAIDQIQNFVAERVRKEFQIDTKPLLYDTTNFFTYIDSHNEKSTLAQRGKNKQKRSDLRQINLALVATKDFQIPLFHKCYDGSIPDVGFFPEVVRDLLGRHAALFGASTDATLVFDKGNLSEETMEKLLYSQFSFVAGIKADVLPEIFSAPLEKFHEALQMPGTRFYEEDVEICGKRCKAVVSYSESFFTQQLASLTTIMAKTQDKLKDLQTYLLAWAGEKKPKGRRPTIASVKDSIKKILSHQYMEKVFTVSLEEHQGLPVLRYCSNRKELERLSSTHFGRTLLITNRLNWLSAEVIATYRDLAHVEDVFRQMKNRDYLRWQPAFHWTDQKIKVHTLYCVLALLLATLARKVAHEGGIELSLTTLLDDLSAIKEVALLYPVQGKLKAIFTLSKMTPRQKKIGDIFEMSEILRAG